MKVLFSHSYFYPLDSKQWAKKQPYPPLGTIQAAAYLREHGHEVELFDTNLLSDPAAIEAAIKRFKPEVLALYDDGFNYLTKMCLTNMREAAFEMISIAERYNLPVLVSSSDSTDQFDLYLDKGADYVMLGEAEETLLELVDTISSNNRELLVKGTAYRDSNQKTINNGKRPVISDLTSLPLPAWDLVDMEAYKSIWLEGNGYFSLNIATTRGCPFKCNWCAKPIYGNRYNSRSPEHVVSEIELLIENYGPTHFWMCDDIFGLKPGWVQEFDKLIKAKNLKFKYTIQSRVDLLLKEDTIDALASSGAYEIWVGAESGSQKVLDAMDKGSKVEQIFEATRMLKSKGVRIAFFLQFGYPEETQEDIQKTIDMVLELMPDNIGVSVSYPLPGTPFYERVKSELGRKANWTESDDLDLMFANTYPETYYRKLQRYIHRMLRKKQGLESIGQLFKDPTKALKSIRIIALFPYYFLTTILDRRTLRKLESQAS
jgi:anaerobic magnesium-protoporphyrin IX monomethyl ester cyclase